MTTLPVISVLIPCWNAAATVEGALASVLEARLPHLDVVVVDDGSTDGTADVVRRIAAADPRVRLEVLPQNVGASVARNRGLELVRGEWLTLLDADDRFAPGGLDRLVAAAVADPDALAIVGQQVWRDGGRTWTTRWYENPAIRVAGRKSLATHPGLLYFVSPHAKLLHRSVWEGLRFEGRMLGDQPWVIGALLRAGDHIEVIDATVYEWDRSTRPGAAGSITGRSRSSARLGVEATTMARAAFEAVSTETAARLPDAARRTVLAVYVERLVRADLGVHLRAALDRGDPEVGDLLDGIAAFVAAIPRELWATSDALATDVLALPLSKWHRVNANGRAAFQRLVAVALAADPGLIARVRGWRYRLAFGLGLRHAGRSGGLAAEIALLGVGLPTRVWHRVRSVVVKRQAPPPRRISRGPTSATAAGAPTTPR